MKSVSLPARTINPILAALFVLFPLSGQAAGTDAGTILQQVKPVTPPAPSFTGTGLKIEQPGSATLPSSAAFEVKTIQITGNSVFDTATLHALVAGAEGSSLTLAQLDEQAAKITAYYRGHGYPLARAIIPAQTIENGVVRIEILEARYGKIKLDNKSRVSDGLLGATLEPLQSGQAIAQAGLDRGLLLLTDIPGVAVNATLRPGEAVGTSDLLVDMAAAPAFSGNAVLDSYGSCYTGRVRAGLSVNYNNPLRYGDNFSFDAVTSGSGMSYGRIGYESLLNGRGTRLGGAYSALHYALGGNLGSLNAHGNATVSSLWVKQPLLRSQEANVYGRFQYEQKRLLDRVDATLLRTDRHLDNWTAAFNGDARVRDAVGAVYSWSLGWTSGQVAFDDAQAQLADAASAKTGGNFSKWNAGLARLQNLSPQNALYLALSAQGSNTNLDAAEKMVAGGSGSVRAYDVGAVSGDNGHLLTAELRHDLPQQWHGQWQAIVFADNVHVTVNKNTWVAGTNGATLSGAGLGFNWTGANQWGAKLYAAKRIGAVPTLVGSAASARAWAEIGKGF